MKPSEYFDMQEENNYPDTNDDICKEHHTDLMSGYCKECVKDLDNLFISKDDVLKLIDEFKGKFWINEEDKVFCLRCRKDNVIIDVDVLCINCNLEELRQKIKELEDKT